MRPRRWRLSDVSPKQLMELRLPGAPQFIRDVQTGKAHRDIRSGRRSCAIVRRATTKCCRVDDNGVARLLLYAKERGRAERA